MIRCKQKVIVWNKYNHIVLNSPTRCCPTLQLAGRKFKFAMGGVQNVMLDSHRFTKHLSLIEDKLQIFVFMAQD